MIKAYLPAFLVAAIISGGLTFYVKLLANRLKLADLPSPRKIHTTPTPRLGGLAIALTFLLLVVGYSLITKRLDFSPFNVWFFDKRLLGALIGVIILMVVGFIDDVRGIAPWKKLVWHIIAASMVVVFGVGISYIRLPGGSHIELTNLTVPITLLGQYHYQFVVWGDLLTIFWIVLLINTLNFLDGLDGLAGGISVIAGISIFFLSLALGQPAVALLAALFAGSVFGFMPWNFYPAKIFMGDSGSMFLGYTLGVLSVISGGKLATAFLALGIPVLDVLWVVIRRLIHGKSPFVADKFHLHHRLLRIGLNQRQAVILLYILAAGFGALAVTSGTQEKIEVSFWLLGVMGALVIALIVLEWKRRSSE